jgi:DNA-binding MarR family transcriptional regulator
VNTMEHGRAGETPRDRATADIEASLADLIRVGKTWNKTLATRFGSELPPLAFGILRYVFLHAPVRSAAIVASFDLDKATVSRAIKALRDKGLIHASPDPSDGRASILEPTERAQRDFERYRTETRAQYRGLLDEWTEEDLSDLARLLGRLMDALPTGGHPSGTHEGSADSSGQ